MQTFGLTLDASHFLLYFLRFLFCSLFSRGDPIGNREFLSEEASLSGFLLKASAFGVYFKYFRDYCRPSNPLTARREITNSGLLLLSVW